MKEIVRKTEITTDGSVTLYIPEIDEHYHSTNGAVTEAMHVYITEALRKRLAAEDVKEIRLLEIGFGTGLNTFLTLIEAITKDVTIRYTTLELYPLNTELIRELNYTELVNPEFEKYFEMIHSAEWGREVKICDNFYITKLNTDLKDFVSEELFDVIFFDAFAPEKQPEMWNDGIYEKMFSHCSDNGILTTYCAKGVVRRGFRDAGFTMERIPGPPGKREMLRANKKTVI